MFAKSGDNTLLDWTAASTADGYAHLVMAPQTVQLILQKFTIRYQFSNSNLVSYQIIR